MTRPLDNSGTEEELASTIFWMCKLCPYHNERQLTDRDDLLQHLLDHHAGSPPPGGGPNPAQDLHPGLQRLWPNQIGGWSLLQPT